MTESAPASELGAPRARRGLHHVDASLRRQSAFLVLTRIGQTLFGMALPIVLVRVLDQSTFGHYKQISLLSATALSLLTLGLPATLYYFVPRAPHRSQSLLVRSAWLLATVGLLGGVAFVLGRPLLARAFAPEVADQALLLGLIVAISVPGALTDVAAVVDRRTRLSALGVSGIEALKSGLVVAVALVTRDLVLVLVAIAAGLALRVAALVGYLVWRRRQHPDDRERFPSGEQLRYALPFFGAALIGMTRDQLHSYFVATQYSAAQFAVYAVGTLPIPFVNKVTQSVAEVVVIDASGKLAAGRVAEVRALWWRATYAVALLIVPLVVIFEFFAADVLALVYGAEYRGAAPVFRVFLLLLLLRVPLSSAMLRANASLRTMALADALSLVATVITLAVCVEPLGVVGAVLSLVVGNVVFNLVGGVRVARDVGIGWRQFFPWGRLAALGAACVVACGAVALATGPLAPALRALAGPALAGAVIAATLWLSPLLPETEREAVRGVLRRGLARARGRSRRPLA